MQHLESSGTPVLYIGFMVFKGLKSVFPLQSRNAINSLRAQAFNMINPCTAILK
jgi:hypothetical protein